MVPSVHGAEGRAAAVVVALHGLAHLAGTGDSFSAAADGDAGDHLAGAWAVSDPPASGGRRVGPRT
jgi:hypothetical protein